MAATMISPLFKLHTTSTGRRVFALAQVMMRAEAQGQTDIVDQAQVAIDHDKQTRLLERRWVARDAPSPLDVVVKPIDAKVDRLLSAMRDAAESKRELATPANGLEVKVDTFLTKVFPLGVKHVTHMPNVEELAEVDLILEKTRGPQAELAPLVAELGLGAHVERLAELCEEYRAALALRGVKEVTWEDVQAARAEGHELMLDVVGRIIAATTARTPEARAMRAELLSPILVQNEAMRQYLRSRRRVEDVDPETGEVDPNAPPSEPPPEVAEAAPPSAQG